MLHSGRPCQALEAAINLICEIMGANPLYIFLLAGGTLAFLIGFFFITILRHHRRYLHLQQERTRNEIIILEKERKRIAYDLHDELGPVLASIKMNLMSLDVSESEQEIVNRSCKRIDDIVQNMRAISYDLLPVTLQRNGLQAAIYEMVERPEIKKHIKSIIEVDADIKLDKEKEIHLFRIIQEVLHNTIKHAKAKTFRIVLEKHHKKYVLVLEDDGVGFDSNIRHESHGLGLKSIESRAQVLNARMLLDTAKGRGSFYFFEMEE